MSFINQLIIMFTIIGFILDRSLCTALGVYMRAFTRAREREREREREKHTHTHIYIYIYIYREREREREREILSSSEEIHHYIITCHNI